MSTQIHLTQVFHTLTFQGGPSVKNTLYIKGQEALCTGLHDPTQLDSDAAAITLVGTHPWACLCLILTKYVITSLNFIKSLLSIIKRSDHHFSWLQRNDHCCDDQTKRWSHPTIPAVWHMPRKFTGLRATYKLTKRLASQTIIRQSMPKGTNITYDSDNHPIFD